MPDTRHPRFSVRAISLLRFARSTLVLLGIAGVCRAAGPPTITMTSSRFAALSDGRDSVEIIAEVRDGSGRFVPDGTAVVFTTNLGIFAREGPSATVRTRSGSARVTMTSQSKGTATVSATVAGGGFQRMDVLFTDDPEETFQGNTWVSVTASGALSYLAAERVIDAASRPPSNGLPALAGAELRFRNLELRAERLQVDCSANTVRASGMVALKRGKAELRAAKLFYNVMTGKGYAVAEQGRSLVPVQIEGMDLKTEPVAIGIAPKFFEMTDPADAKLVIVARQITLFPGEKLQFKRPRFYEDGQHLFTLAFYSLSLYSNQLFSDQFLSLGTQGVGVDLPLYYDLTPASRGLVRVKYGERYGSAYARRPGLALDLIQAYNSTQRGRYAGEFGFTGVTRSDWGFRWTHSQELGADTRTGLHLDFPQHRSVFGSGNVGHRMGGLYLGLNASANSTLTGPSSSGTHADAYVETIPAKLASTRAMYSLGASISTSRTRSGEFRSYGLTQGLQARMFTPSIRLDRSTTLSNALSVGHTWSKRGATGATVNATVSAMRSLGGSSSLQVGYDYLKQPVNYSEGDHRLSFSLSSGEQRWGLYLYNTMVLDAGAMSFVGDLYYLLAPRWRMSLSASAHRYSAGSYSDYIVSLARNLAGRDLVLSYSTLHHRFMLDLEATRF
ncbi:MAG: hypothetical protein GX446_01720 [Chthonomonadales bacterium]|nr:hypothetical protein [Chthonomonadales bacterium]